VKSDFPIVGVIGAGQLTQMMIAPATALGVKLLPFASSASDSAAQITPHVIGDYKDLKAVKKFADLCDVVTFEDELIPLSIIKSLERAGVAVRPSSETLEYSQNKEDMRKKLSHIYSPKNQVEVTSPEIVLLVARSPHSQAASWTPTQIIQKNGICSVTVSPAPLMTAEVSEKAQKIALDIAAEIKLIGVMAVSMFIKDNEISLNEIALCPQNSGQWTLEGSRTSQFEQHLRAILDLPLGDTSMTDEFSVMGNILGKEKTNMYRPYLHLMARNPSLKFHMYSKEVRPGRKIGHVNIIGKDLMHLRSEIEHAIDYMSGEIDE
jgi:5-(carboxyamino)imidazole ribonucleotide synthase